MTQYRAVAVANVNEIAYLRKTSASLLVCLAICSSPALARVSYTFYPWIWGNMYELRLPKLPKHAEPCSCMRMRTPPPPPRHARTHART